MKLLKLFLALGIIMFIYNCSSDQLEMQDTAKTEITPLCDHDHSDTSETKQTSIYTVDRFTPCDAPNLYVLVDLSDCENDDLDLYQCGIDGAIAAYNALPATIGIGMTVITDIADLPAGESLNIEIGCGALRSMGSTTRRKSSSDVSQITIHDDATNASAWPCESGPNCCQMQWIVMHELGHALGLGHTDGNTPNSLWIPGTPTTDEFSIMNSGLDFDCDAQGCTFTQGDLDALEYLYPTTNMNSIVNIDGPDVACVGDIVEFCLDGIDLPIKNPGLIVWSATKENTKYSVACTNYSFDEPGTKTIRATLCYPRNSKACCIPIISKTIQILPEGECGDRCFCNCWVEEQSGDDGPYLEEIPIDCAEQGPCENIIPDWWHEYLVYPIDCERVVK